MPRVIQGYNWESWYPKTNKEEYQNQLKEVVNDVKDLGLKFLDVGCGNGRIKNALHDLKKTVHGVDLTYNFIDVVNDDWNLSHWNMVKRYWVLRQYDCVFSSLLFTVLNEQEAEAVAWKMTSCLLSGNYLYCFEEFNPQTDCGVSTAREKYNHNMKSHLKNMDLVYAMPSSLNQKWYRWLFKKP